MQVYLIRHAQAVAGDNHDAMRSLDEIGQQQASKLAQWITTQIADTTPSLFSSPYLRAKQTAQAIANELKQEVQEQDFLTPDVNSYVAMDKLLDYPNDLIVVTHQPLVGALCSQLLLGIDELQPWSTAECRVFNGDMLQPAGMSIQTLWYPH